MIIPSDSIQKTANDILISYINYGNFEAGYALLVEHEANLEIKNNLGMTPLLYAVKNNNLTFVNLLLDFGADPNSKSDYNVGSDSALTIACDNDYFCICSLLLDFGANPNEKNNTGLACIHLAAQKGFIDIVLLLISRGGDINLRDDYGNNAAFYAKKYKHTELLEHLTQPAFISPEEMIEYKDQVDEKRFEINADDKKKIRAQIAKDLKAEENKKKAKAKNN